MSESEQRQIRAMALLEAEEAKQHLALLQSKVQRWSRMHEKVTHLLAQARREDAHLKRVVLETRADLMRNLEEAREVMDLDALLALDDELQAAAIRVENSEVERKRLGFN